MTESAPDDKIKQIEVALNAFSNTSSLEMLWDVFRNHPELLNGEAEQFIDQMLQTTSDERRKEQLVRLRDKLSNSRANYLIDIYLKSESWDDAIRCVQRFPKLFSEDVEQALQNMENYFRSEEKDISYADFLSEQRRFLKLCREKGIGNAASIIISDDQLLNSLLELMDIDTWQDTKSYLVANPFLLSERALQSLDIIISHAKDGADGSVLATFLFELHRHLLERCYEDGVDTAFSKSTNPLALFKVLKFLEGVYRRYEKLDIELEKYPEIITPEAEELVEMLTKKVEDTITLAFLNLIRTLQSDWRAHGKDAALGHVNLHLEKRIREERMAFASAAESINSMEDLLQLISKSPSLAKDFLDMEGGEYQADVPGLSQPQDNPYAEILAESDELSLDIQGQIPLLLFPPNSRQEFIQRLDRLEKIMERLDQESTPNVWAFIQNLYGQTLTGIAENGDMLEKAIQAQTAALEVFTKKDNPYLWALVNNDLGISYYERFAGDKTENMDKAIDAFMASLEIRTPKDLPDDWMDTSSNLAAAHMMRFQGGKVESIDRAIQIYLQILESNIERDRPEFWAGIQNNLGLATTMKASSCKDENERVAILTQSIEHIRRSLEIYSESEFPIDWGMANLNLGNSLRLRNQPEDMEPAVNAYSTALEIFTLPEFPQEWAKTKIAIANLYQINNEPDKSLTILHDVTENCPEHLHLFKFIASGLLGTTFYEKKQWEQAYEYLKTSIRSLETLRLAAFTEETRLLYNREPGYFYKFMVGTCIQLGRYQEAFEYIEASKSRIFLEQLATDDFRISAHTESDATLIQQEHELLGELRGIEISLQYGLGFNAIRKSLVRQEEIIVALRAVWDGLEKDYPDYVLLRRGSTADYDTIKKFLHRVGRHAALVEYYDLFGRTIAFVIRPDREEPILVETGLTAADIHSAVRKYLGSIMDVVQFDLEDYWQEFSSKLFGTLVPYLADIEFIYLVPHGQLHFVPFYAANISGRNVVDLFSIVSSPSATILERIYERDVARISSSTQKALILGNPTLDLPAARLEADALSEILQTQPHLGARATKELVIQGSQDMDILHFACHGFFNPENPMESGILLANHEPLTAKEILGLQLRSNLVTLSACLTGLNMVDEGDELSGLTRAFLYAGASSVLVSLWPIHDETTAEFMVEFYRRLMDKDNQQTISEVLRDVMLSIRSRKPQPYYWAPFTLIGVG